MANSVLWYECLAPLEKTVTFNIATWYNIGLLDAIERSLVHEWWTGAGGDLEDPRFSHYLATWQLTPGVIPLPFPDGTEVYYLGISFWLDLLVTIFDTPADERVCPIKQFGFPV